MSRPVRKFIESARPADTVFRVHHYHDGNDPKGKNRRGFRYATRAALVDTHTHKELCVAWARCSKKDTPRKSVSRQIAVGRALKKYFMDDEAPF